MLYCRKYNLYKQFFAFIFNQNGDMNKKITKAKKFYDIQIFIKRSTKFSIAAKFL